MVKSIRVLGSALALSLALAGCQAANEVGEGGDDDGSITASVDAGSSGSDSSESGSGDTGERRTLRFGGYAADAGQTDPHFAAAGSDRQLMDAQFDGLVRYKPGDVTADFEPDIAEEVPEVPDPNDDGTQTWEFTIREGVMCHPGPETESYELTAEDVVWSYEKSVDPDRSAYSGDYQNWRSIEATGENTVEITLETPRSAALFFPLVANFSGGYVVCGKAYEAQGGQEGFNTHPVGTGPFMFESYSPGNSYNVVAFDEYWRGQPRLAAIEFRYMPDDSSRTLALQAGEIDATWGPTEQQWVDRVNQMDGITGVSAPIGGLEFMEINTKVEPFDDIRVRQAVMYAINRDAHVAMPGEGVAEKVWSVVHTQGAPGGLTEEQATELGLDYNYDPDRARELLAEAGLADGFSFKVTTSELAVYSDHYQIAAANLAEVGIDMQVDVVDHPTMHQLIREGANPIVFYFAPRPTIDTLFFQFFAGSSIVVEGEAPITNFSYWGEADDLIEEAQQEIDADHQVELWEQVNIKILEDAVAKPIFMGNNTWGISDEVDLGYELVATLESSLPLNESTGFAG